MHPFARLTLLPLAATAALTFTGCDVFDDDDNDSPVAGDDPQDLTEVAEANGLTTLVSALEAADLDNTIATGGPFTVFAPDNDAFAALGTTLDDLLLPGNQAQLADILQYHVLDGETRAADVTGAIYTTALNGDRILVDNVAGSVYVNDVPVVTADVEADNGVAHVIGTVLTVPQTVAATLTDLGNHQLLLEALGDNSLAGNFDEDSDGPLTVFAPTDAAFQAVNGAWVPGGDNDLSGLSDTLLYHVLDGDVAASDAIAVAGSATPTVDPLLAGSDKLIEVSVVGGNVTLNETSDDATVTVFNIVCTNGTIHVIDTVLSIPPDAPTEPVSN